MDEIRKFYRKNKRISITGALAIGISILYIATYHWLDDPIVGQACSWIYNLSIGYTAAVIFYIVDVYIKEEENEKKFIACMKTEFAGIIRFIELTLSACDRHVKINDKGAVLSWNGIDKNGEKKLYVKYLDDSENSYMYEIYTEQEIFTLGKTFKQKIEGIRNNPIIKFCDYKLLELLTKLEEEDLFLHIEVVLCHADEEVCLQDFNKTVANVKDLTHRIKEIFGIDRTYHLEEVNDSDRDMADKIRKNIWDKYKTHGCV